MPLRSFSLSSVRLWGLFLVGLGGCYSPGDDPNKGNEGLASQAQPVWGGESDSSTPENNWVVFLSGVFMGTSGDCSGSLITPNHILTAAHCVATIDENNEISATPPPSMFRLALIARTQSQVLKRKDWRCFFIHWPTPKAIRLRTTTMTWRSYRSTEGYPRACQFRNGPGWSRFKTIFQGPLLS